MSLEITLDRDEAAYRGRVVRDDGFVYLTEICGTEAEALSLARRFANWHEDPRAETIYYILAVPHSWPGPHPQAHRYSGLDVKIGRTRDLMMRVANLRTGTTSQLIIHAIEPGDSKLERERHEQFAKGRRQGEWFSCSPRLAQQIFRVWWRNNLLPPQHQAEVLLLQERIDTYLGVREIIGGPPDLVNPSLGEPWHGKVMVDLVYAMPGGVPRHTSRHGTSPLVNEE